MRTLKNIHPGEALKEEFLVPIGISAYLPAKETGLSQTRIGQIINGGVYNRKIREYEVEEAAFFM
jgi:antitoxin HigA-1